MSELNKAYYQSLQQKINQYGYTIMGVVSENPRSEGHAAYCYTIGLSDYGYPEIMMADCLFSEMELVADLILELIHKSEQLPLGTKLRTPNGVFKSIELLDGVKEELTAHAQKYFESMRSDNTSYELVYMAKADGLGLFPDEKAFEETDHVKRIFYKHKTECFSGE